MSKRKTKADFVLSLPAAIAEAVLGTMTSSQRAELSAEQAGAIARVDFLDDLVDDVESPAAFMAAELLDALLSELGAMSGTWSQLSHDQQNRAIESLRVRIRTSTETAIARIAAGKFQAARVELESVTVKKAAKATLILTDGKHYAVDGVGRKGVLILCEPEQYFRELEDRQAEDPQGTLDLDADDPPDDEEPEDPAGDAPPPDDDGPEGDLDNKPDRTG